MATAKKLPSGNYRVRVYDKITDKYKSFTAPTKREAERLANEYLDGKRTASSTELTVGRLCRIILTNAATYYLPLRSANISGRLISSLATILNKSDLTNSLSNTLKMR